MFQARHLVQIVGGGDDLPAALLPVGEGELLRIAIRHQHRHPLPVAVDNVEGMYVLGIVLGLPIRAFDRSQRRIRDLFGPASGVVRLPDRLPGKHLHAFDTGLAPRTALHHVLPRLQRVEPVCLQPAIADGNQMIQPLPVRQGNQRLVFRVGQAASRHPGDPHLANGPPHVFRPCPVQRARDHPGVT